MGLMGQVCFHKAQGHLPVLTQVYGINWRHVGISENAFVIPQDITKGKVHLAKERRQRIRVQVIRSRYRAR